MSEFSQEGINRTLEPGYIRLCFLKLFFEGVTYSSYMYINLLFSDYALNQLGLRKDTYIYLKKISKNRTREIIYVLKFTIK